MSKATWTKGRPFDPSTHTRLRKYQIRYVAGYWIARVPYGSWRRFDTWGLATLWLRVRHEERLIQAEKRARRKSDESEREA